jgi:hypothetical protein
MPGRSDDPIPIEPEERWQAPYMPWFESDFSGSFHVRTMQPLARLMYRSLLAHSWHSDNPPYLPNNEAVLMKMADAPTPEAWAEHKEVILARFQITENGKELFHPKTVREYDRARREHDRKAQAGRQRWAGAAQQKLGATAVAAQQEPSSSTAQAQHQQADIALLSPHNHNHSHSHNHNHNHNQPTSTSTSTNKKTGAHTGFDRKDYTTGLKKKPDGSFGF